MNRALRLINAYDEALSEEPQATNEGVINVPKELYQKAEDFLWWSILSRHYDTFNASEESDPAFYRYITKQFSKYKVRKVVLQNGFKKRFNYDLKTFSKNYPLAKAPRIMLVVVTDPVRLKNGDYFMASAYGKYAPKRDRGDKGVSVQNIVINASTLDFDQFPSIEDGLTVSAFKRHMATLESSLEHEFQHSIQFTLLKKVDKSQVSVATTDQYPNASKLELYYLSPLEFDPQIVSAISDYQALVDDNRAWMDDGEVELASFEELTTSTEYNSSAESFFAALKKYDNKRWKIAVKKLRELLINRYSTKL